MIIIHSQDVFQTQLFVICEGIRLKISDFITESTSQQQWLYKVYGPYKVRSFSVGEKETFGE